MHLLIYTNYRAFSRHRENVRVMLRIPRTDETMLTPALCSSSQLLLLPFHEQHTTIYVALVVRLDLVTGPDCSVPDKRCHLPYCLRNKGMNKSFSQIYG